MKTNLVERALWGLTLVATATGVVEVRAQMVAARKQVEAWQPPILGASRHESQADSVDHDLRTIEEGNLFRPEREPAVVATVASAESQRAVSAALSPPKPRLLLRGLIGGPPWDAILDGIPGRDGSIVLRAGDSIAGLKVRSIHAESVTIRGMDTTWILKLSRLP